MVPPMKGPQAPQKPIILSESRELVPVGPRHVTAHMSATRRDENGKRPTTSRALVLRNGKYGAMGTGEVSAFGKLSGREKLELLAEDLIEISKTALASPFRMDQCKTIADSQFNARLDAISNLQDPDLFCDIIKTEVRARHKKLYERGRQVDPLTDSVRVASVIATCIHNAYMLASAWRIVCDMLDELDEGIEDKFIRNRLASDADYRRRYLSTLDFVNVLVDVGHAQFQVLVTTTDHYGKYFRNVSGGDPDAPDLQFNFSELKTVYKSFLDSIIIELCLPESSTPRRILYQVLHEAVDEAPRDAKRFPQTMWDAVGDLAIMLQLQEILEAPLYGPEGEEWKNAPRPTLEEYETWQDAQLFSKRALQATANWKDIVQPIEKTRKLDVLQKMWQTINANYYATSKQYIDALWGIDGALDRKPRWRSHEVRPDELVRRKAEKRDAPTGGPGSRLALEDGYDSDDSMPSLQTVSDSDDNFSDEESSDDFETDDEDDEYDYETDDEEFMRDLLREAMETATGIEGMFDPRFPAPAMDTVPEDRKGNPFLKLLSSLRGRMFSSEPKLKTTSKDTPRGGYAATAPAKDAFPKARALGNAPAPQGFNKSRKVTVEEVEDEDDIPSAKKKKKSKPKKKKKKTSGGGAGAKEQEEDVLETIEEDKPATPPPRSPTPEANAPASPVVDTSPVAKKNKKKKKPSGSVTSPVSDAARASLDSTVLGSTISLASSEQTAQSAYAYRKQEGLNQEKVKVKSRPGHASIFTPGSGDKGGGWVARLSKKEEKVEVESKKKRQNFFSNLSRKTSTYMHQLLHTSEDVKKGQGSMRWDAFVKVMEDMGFKYIPSTAGSSVRFDPADHSLKSITFHKPHPDSTIHPVMLKEFSKKLRAYYGWSEEDFTKGASK